MTWRMLDLFSGLAGFTLAAHEVWGDDLETVSFVEIDKRCRGFLAKAWPGVPIHEDIKTLDATRWRGTIDLLTAGVPCQPASRSGKQRGKEDDRWLWDQALRVCEECLPTWALFENPIGLGDVGLDGILTHLEGIGYEVQTVDIPACAVGAPHLRHRYWIICWFGNSGHKKSVCQPKEEESGLRCSCDESTSSSRRDGRLENPSKSRPRSQSREACGQGRKPVDSGTESIRCRERQTCSNGADPAGADLCHLAAASSRTGQEHQAASTQKGRTRESGFDTQGIDVSHLANSSRTGHTKRGVQSGIHGCQDAGEQKSAHAEDIEGHLADTHEGRCRAERKSKDWVFDSNAKDHLADSNEGRPENGQMDGECVCGCDFQRDNSTNNVTTIEKHSSNLEHTTTTGLEEYQPNQDGLQGSGDADGKLVYAEKLPIGTGLCTENQGWIGRGRSSDANAWSSYVWLPCADSKIRRAIGTSQRMAHGLPVELLTALGEEGREDWTPEDCEPHRSLLGALGNSIVLQVAMQIMKAIKEASR